MRCVAGNLVRAGIAVLLLACSGTAFPQATADEIASELKGRPLFLRGQWRDNKLKFDLTGALPTAAPYLSFTLCGVDVQSVKQKSDHLQITGRRVGLSFAPAGTFKRVALDGPYYDSHMSLEIAGPPGSDYGPAVRAIFAPDLANMISELPPYWSTYARGHFTTGPAVAGLPTIFRERTPAEAGNRESAAQKRDLTLMSGRPMHVGGNVRPPRVLKTVEPSFTDAARVLKKSGNVELYLVVDAEGTPGHFQIMRALGLGLDEAAVDAVTKYVFEPARQNGKPVIVDLYIDVNFQIF